MNAKPAKSTVQVNGVVRRTWSKTKPTTPGAYYTRWPSGACVNEVIVRRKGRGMQVYCERYNDSVPMSRIGDDELEWLER